MTGVTTSEANRLLSTVGVATDRTTKIVHARRNSVFLCGNGLVLRVAGRCGDLLLCRETALLEQFRGSLPIPEVVNCGVFEGRCYQLMRRISGEPLLFAWRHATNAAKDASVRRLLEWLDLMHRERYSQFGYAAKSSPGFDSWSGYSSSQID